MNPYRQQINDILKQAKELSHNMLITPQPERVYLVGVGKYQQLLAQARLIKEKFLDPQTRVEDAEVDLPDDPDQDADTTIDPPRTQSRLAQARAKHRPRSI